MKREPRQLNVQQQNARTERSIRDEAEYWRKHGLPEALRICGEDRGIDWKKSIVINLQENFPGCSTFYGVIVSQDERFISFDIDIDAESNMQIHQWDDVTNLQNMSKHNRGTGVGYGALAIKILHQLDPVMCL